MEIKSVRAVYFSATRTTEKIVTCISKTIADIMGAEYKPYSFSLPQARTRQLAFSKDDLVVLGVPVYAGRVPNVLLPFIKEKIMGDGTLAVPIVLFGNRDFDDALIELRNIMRENGFHTISAGAFVGEHSFSSTLAAGRPDDDDMALAVKLGEETARKIKNMTDRPAEAIHVTGKEPIRPYYTPRDRNGNPINILKVKPNTDISKCANCGVCRDTCVMGSIDACDASKIGGICIKCCACIKQCPVGAKYFDDEGYLYHKHELEDVYKRRAASELFYQNLNTHEIK